MALLDLIRGKDEAEKREIFKNYFNTETRRNKIPYNMILELTPFCTLSCKMCYVRKNPHDQSIEILNDWFRVVDQAVEMGVMFATLTGGEAMLHPLFYEIYEKLYRNGVSISLITNGTLFNDENILFFKKMPPTRVNVSLYGFSSETYEKTCGNGDAFNKVMKTVCLLKSNGINFLFQTTPTNDMVDDIPLIYDYAKKLDIPCFCNVHLAVMRDCTMESVDGLEIPIERRVSLLKELSLIDGKEYRESPPLDDEYRNDKIVGTGMMCGAGNNYFCITWDGYMQPCVSFDMIRINIRNKKLQECWSELVDVTSCVKQIPECQICEYRNNCTTCIARHYGDTKQYGVLSKRLCRKHQLK